MVDPMLLIKNQQFKQQRVQRTGYCRGRRNECEECVNGGLKKENKSDIEKQIKFKENMVEWLQKANGENKGFTKQKYF